MEWLKAPKNIGVFRNKIVNLRNFVENLIEYGGRTYCGFRIEARVEVAGLDILEKFLRSTQILNLENALSLIGIQSSGNSSLYADNAKVLFLRQSEYLNRLRDTLKVAKELIDVV
jgi:hypothetical protein